MASFLLQPYPIRRDFNFLFKVNVVISVSIVLCLILCQPFHFDEFEGPYKLPITLGYGLLTLLLSFFSTYFFPRLFPRLFDEEKWRVWKQILWVTWLFLFIGSANLLYSHRLGFVPLTLGGFLRFQFITLIVGFTPVSIVVLMLQIRLLKQNLDAALSLTENLKNQGLKTSFQPIVNSVRLVAENEKDILETDPDHLLVIAAAENYVELYMSKNGEVKKILFRCTLKRAEETLKAFPAFYRCHRSYLVNTSKVAAVTGNAQGLRLHFDGMDQDIPVARNQRKGLESRLQ